MPRYERWGTPSGREGVQRTLDPADEQDREFLSQFRIVDEHGNWRNPTFAEAEAMGVRRSVAVKDIRTGEMRSDSPDTPFFIVKGGS